MFAGGRHDNLTLESSVLLNVIFLLWLQLVCLVIDEHLPLLTLTPFCLASPQLCLSVGLRLPRCNRSKMTTWIQKAITCLVGQTMFSNLGNKCKIGYWFQLCWFSICWVVIFQSITWPCSNVSSGAIRTQTLRLEPFSYLYSVYLLKKIITRINKFIVGTWFLNAVACQIQA